MVKDGTNFYSNPLYKYEFNDDVIDNGKHVKLNNISNGLRNKLLVYGGIPEEIDEVFGSEV